jgi:putative SOS response-associated peptidase YedK
MMCGRITLTRPNLESIASELDVDPIDYRGYPIYEPHYNVAPTLVLPILTLQGGKRHISPMYWGTTPKNQRRMLINWRSESFPPRSPRCAVITDGFYEWVRHEVACVIVRRHHRAEPAVPSAVSYEVWRLGNESSKSPRTMYPSVARWVSVPRGKGISASIEAERG